MISSVKNLRIYLSFDTVLTAIWDVKEIWALCILGIGHLGQKTCLWGQNILCYFPCGPENKQSAFNMGDLGSIPGSGRSPGEGNAYPFQYSCLENSMDRGAWQATNLYRCKVKRNWTTNTTTTYYTGFSSGSVVKNLPANAGDAVSIPGSGRSPGEGNGKPTPVFLPWKIPWTEEPGGLQSMGSQRVEHNLAPKQQQQHTM